MQALTCGLGGRYITGGGGGGGNGGGGFKSGVTVLKECVGVGEVLICNFVGIVGTCEVQH